MKDKDANQTTVISIRNLHFEELSQSRKKTEIEIELEDTLFSTNLAVISLSTVLGGETGSRSENVPMEIND